MQVNFCIVIAYVLQKEDKNLFSDILENFIEKYFNKDFRTLCMFKKIS